MYVRSRMLLVARCELFRALYEQMFRAEPRKHVSRPTFMTVMRRVYGFNTAPLAGQVDQAALHKLGKVSTMSGVEELTALFKT